MEQALTQLDVKILFVYLVREVVLVTMMTPIDNKIESTNPANHTTS